MKKTQFSLNDHFFGALDVEGNFLLWDCDSWIKVDRMQMKNVSNFIFAENYLSIIAADSTISFYDLAGLQKVNSQRMKLDVAHLELFQNANKIAIVESGPDTSIVLLINLRSFETKKISLDGYFSSMAISGDGNYLVTVTTEDEVRLWTANGIQKMKFKLYAINWVSFSSDSKCFFVFDGELHGWNMEGEECFVSTKKFEPTGRKGPGVSSFLISPNGRFGLTSTSNYVALSDMKGGTLLNEVWSRRVPGYEIDNAMFTNNDSLLITLERGNTIRVWDTETGFEKARYCYDGKIIRTEAMIYDPIKSYSISSKGKFFAVATQNNDSVHSPKSPLYIFETKGYDHSLKMWYDDEPSAIDVVTDSNSTFLASGGFHINGFVTIGDISTGKETRKFFTEKPSVIASISFDPSTDRIAFANYDNGFWVWNWKDSTLVFSVDTLPKIEKLTFSKDGRYLATAGRDNHARVWDLMSKKQILTLRHYDSVNQSVNDVAFNSKGNLLITSSDDKTCCIWSFPEGKKLATLNHEDAIRDISFDPRGRYIVTASLDNHVGLWNVPDGRNLFKYDLGKIVNRVVFSPDGKYFAAASGDCCGLKGGDMTDGKVSIWRTSDQKKISELPHPFTVWDIDFSPDGKHIVSGSYDGYVRIWELSSEKVISRIIFEFSSGEVRFSPDGKYIAGTGEAYLWKPEDLIKEVEKRKVRELKKEERKQFLEN